MSVLNIASLAVAMETCDPWILAKLAIFATDINALKLIGNHRDHL